MYSLTYKWKQMVSLPFLLRDKKKVKWNNEAAFVPISYIIIDIQYGFVILSIGLETSLSIIPMQMLTIFISTLMLLLLWLYVHIWYLRSNMNDRFCVVWAIFARVPFYFVYFHCVYLFWREQQNDKIQRQMRKTGKYLAPQQQWHEN